jgi:putative component of membrane protein insertase Oxa1/YidC/SpoIIIJ protein YidD
MKSMPFKLLLGLMSLNLLVSCAHGNGTKEDAGTVFNPLHAFVRIYQEDLDHFSAVRASECPMYPSCSEYSKQAAEQYGPFLGWMMSVDRLMRCGRDETRLSPKVYVKGRWKIYDPLENNSFWWAGNTVPQMER